MEGTEKLEKILSASGKENMIFFCQNGYHNVYNWVGAGKDCIEDLYAGNEHLSHLDLRLVLLFEN